MPADCFQGGQVVASGTFGGGVAGEELLAFGGGALVLALAAVLLWNKQGAAGGYARR